MSRPCYCGQLYTCPDCDGDVCQCTCEVDGAPQTSPVPHDTHPNQSGIDAWATKKELTS